MNFIKIFFLTGIVTLLYSCGGSSYSPQEINENLSYAEDALHAGQYDTAIEICNDLLDSPDTTSFTWSDYTRAATIYAVAYDHDIDTEASMASAGRCLSRACKLQPDSVHGYIYRHSPEYAAALNTVIQTLDGLNTDRSTIGDHEEDGFADDATDHDHEHDSNS